MLDVRNVNSFYGDSHILHGVSLAVSAGQRIAILGRNGAGKTTLLRSLMNAGPSVQGDVLLDDRSLIGRPPHEIAKLGLSLVPEDRRIFPHLSLLENMALTRSAAGDRGSFEVEELLAFFPMLQELRGRRGNQLSGGQQQMLAVARGFLPRPRLLLLDEPTEGLAPIIVQQLLKVVVELCDKVGAALILCEQNIWFARRCTDSVRIIDSGALVFQGDWAALDRQEDIKRRYLAV